MKWLDAALRRGYLTLLRKRGAPVTPTWSVGHNAAMAQEFTAAEKQVLAALAQGDGDREIADALTIPQSTLRRHYENVAEKLLERRQADG